MGARPSLRRGEQASRVATIANARAADRLRTASTRASSTIEAYVGLCHNARGPEAGGQIHGAARAREACAGQPKHRVHARAPLRAGPSTGCANPSALILRVRWRAIASAYSHPRAKTYLTQRARGRRRRRSARPNAAEWTPAWHLHHVPTNTMIRTRGLARSGMYSSSTRMESPKAARSPNCSRRCCRLWRRGRRHNRNSSGQILSSPHWASDQMSEVGRPLPWSLGGISVYSDNGQNLALFGPTGIS